MPNPYVNKVELADGTSLIDISDTTAVAADVASGKYFYTASGEKVQGTGSGGGGFVITDTTDSHGGTIRTITGGIAISGTKSITENGTNIDVTNYAAVDVAVPSTVDYPVFTITWDIYGDITSIVCDKTYAECVACWGNRDYRATMIFVMPGNPDMLNGAYALSYEGQGSTIYYAVEVSGDPVADYIISYTSAGVLDFYPSGIDTRTSTDLSASGATVTAPAGYYPSSATKTIDSGTEGTPTATKGTVSNHSVSVTPSVTNTSGYINGSTKTGTAVSVSASELVSGSETKSANGTYDVTNLASLVVAVPIVTYYTGSSTPSSSLGSNGDIYLKTT